MLDPTHDAAQNAYDASDDQLLQLHVQIGTDLLRSIDAAAGFSAMELMRAAGLPIKAECGGSGICATCHCRIPAEWAAKLPAPATDELDKLDEIFTADERSRLSCQITMTDALDGLIVELQPDSWDHRGLDAAE